MNLNATLIGQSIAFMFFVWFCMKFVWPPLTKALSDRQKKIADGLAAADKAEKDLVQAHDKVAELLKNARAEAQGIIELANKRASQIVDEAKDKARTEGDQLKAAASAEIEQEANRAREALRAQVAALAVAGAERILGENLDEAANSKLVNDLAAELLGGHKTMELTTCARPYAKAAFEYAREAACLSEWSDMLSLCASVTAYEKIVALLGNPGTERCTAGGCHYRSLPGGSGQAI